MKRLRFAVALLVSCQPTSIHLRVQVPGEADLSGSMARLIIGDEPICGGGLLYFGRTDSAGKLHIYTKACGEARLVVSRTGRRTVVRKLDTCDVNGLEVVLGPAPPARPPGDACAAVARDFTAAWVEGDHERARSFWANPDDYARHNREPASEQPHAIDFAPSSIAGDRCRVLFTERYDTGCDLSWQLELEPGDGSWRLHSMAYVPPVLP